MVRHEIDHGPITIAYGLDHVSGVILSVCDHRIDWDENASEEMNELSYVLGAGSGEGYYIHLHTGPFGLGHKDNVHFGLPAANSLHAHYFVLRANISCKFSFDHRCANLAANCRNSEVLNQVLRDAKFLMAPSFATASH